MHVTPGVGAASDEKDEAVVGADAHRESRLRHLGGQGPLVDSWVVPLDAAANVLAYPSAERVKETVEGAHPEFAPVQRKCFELKK